MEQKQTVIDIPHSIAMVNVLGVKDCYLDIIKDIVPDVRISVGDNSLSLWGSKDLVDKTARMVNLLVESASTHESISKHDFKIAAKQIFDGYDLESNDENVIIRHHGKEIRVRTPGQLEYLRSLRKNDITVCTSPAGASKTYTAVTYGIHLLRENVVDKIIITRPMIEAGGEKIGAEPGDMTDKLTNWLLPCLDVFERILGKDVLNDYIDRGKIQMFPLGRMRGLSFYRTYCIADEMQNSSIVLAKLLVTRIGEGSKIVVCGDTDQKDGHGISGLEYLAHSLNGIDGVGVIEMTDKDVIRHPIITSLLDAFKRSDEELRVFNKLH